MSKNKQDKSRYNPSQPSLFKDADPLDYEIDDDQRHRLLETLLSLSSVKGIGFITLCHMFDAGILHRLWTLSRDDLAERWHALPGKQQVDLMAVFDHDLPSIRRAGEEAVKELERQGIVFVPQGHKDYPPSLYRLEDPPRWIFVKGNLATAHIPSVVAVIGTRKPSREGVKLAYRFGKELVSRNAIVLAGLAKGIDEQAHRAAVDNYGRSIAVLGHGINANRTATTDVLTSKIIESDGLVISEYLPYEHPSRDRYLRRNELQAALSQVVVPVECPSLASGTGATIRRALRIGTNIAGILPADTTQQTLLATKQNLEDLQLPVFVVMDGNGSSDLWAYLREKMPGHDWSVDPRPRQDTFFRLTASKVASVKDELALDNQAIDRLAESIKQLLDEIEK